MKISCHQGGAELPVSRQEWNELLAVNETNTPFQTWEWFVSWWQVFREKQRPLIITAHQGQRLVGLAPLMVVERAFRGPVIEFCASERSDYCDVLCSGDKEEFLGQVIDLLIKEQTCHRVISLKNIPQQSATAALLQSWCARRGLQLISDTGICPSLRLDRCADIEKVAVPRSLRRHLSALQRDGGVSFTVLRDGGAALSSLDEFFRQHIERWQPTKHPSLFIDPLNREFYRELVRQAIDSGWLFFSRIEHQSRSIAFHFGFDYRGTVYWYKPSFDPSMANRSPGRIMIKHLIDYCVEQGRRELDFTIGQEEFKSSYANDQKKVVALNIFLSKRDYLVERTVRQVRSLIKKVVRSFLEKRRRTGDERHP
jgi:CelD/BcsL family acetyltransferase involved in cellulose biosynthesis